MAFVFNPISGQFDQTGSGSAQVNSDWNATTGVAQILNKPTIQTFDQSLNSSDDVNFNSVQIYSKIQVGTPSDYAALTLDGVTFYPITVSSYATGYRGLLVFDDQTSSLWLNKNNSSMTRIAETSSSNSFTAGQTITASANTSALTASYSVTGANTTPLINLSGTWNTTGVARGILLNITDTASAATSLLLDVQSSGTSAFSVNKFGSSYGTGGFSFTPASNTGTFSFVSASTGAVAFNRGSTTLFVVRGDGLNYFNLSSSLALGWNGDTWLYRDAANTIAQRNGTNAQTYRLYGVFSDASNGRRLDITSTTGGVFTLTATGNGTGASGNILKLTAPVLIPTSSVTLATNGDLAFEATSNTTLTIRYRGSDGTTRSAAITLA
jgi:hypothetical protein